MKYLGLVAQSALTASALSLSAFTLSAPAQAEHLAPRDECSALEGVDGFRMALTTAVINRDEAMLRPLVHPRVQLDFGGGQGWALLQQRLRDDGLWGELEKILPLGCARTVDGELALPWVWNQDMGIEDAFSAWLTLGSAVPLRTSPNADAPIIRRMKWEAIEQIGDWQGNEDFIHVRTKRGEEGYAPVAQLRHQLDYRLLVRQGDKGAWQITYLIAGD